HVSQHLPFEILEYHAASEVAHARWRGCHSIRLDSHGCRGTCARGSKSSTRPYGLVSLQLEGRAAALAVLANESRISCVPRRPHSRKMAFPGCSTRSGRPGTTASCAC